MRRVHFLSTVTVQSQGLDIIPEITPKTRWSRVAHRDTTGNVINGNDVKITIIAMKRPYSRNVPQRKSLNRAFVSDYI